MGQPVAGAGIGDRSGAGVGGVGPGEAYLGAAYRQEGLSARALIATSGGVALNTILRLLTAWIMAAWLLRKMLELTQT